jgi:hypothetical protein
VSRHKRQSFLATCHSWLPFKELFSDVPDEEIVSAVKKDANRIFQKTAASKTKRMSFLATEALEYFQTKQSLTPGKKPLSSGDVHITQIIYMSHK